MNHHRRLLSTLATLAAVALPACRDAAFRTPPRFRENALICTENELLIAGGQRAEVIVEDPKPPAHQAVAYTIPANGKAAERTEVGTGEFLYAAGELAGRVYAIRREEEDGYLRESHLLRSRDAGRSWEEVLNAPADLIGVGFYSESAGWVWSRTKLYRTEDSGSSWKELAPPRPFPRWGLYASVDHTGSFWFATRPGGDESSRAVEIVRLLSNLEFEITALPPGFAVDEFFVDDAARAWIVGTGSRVELELLRVSSKGNVERVAEFAESFPKHLWAKAPDAVVALSELGTMTPRRWIEVSRNGGHSWRELPYPGMRFSSICPVDATKVWVVNALGFVYPPE